MWLDGPSHEATSFFILVGNLVAQYEQFVNAKKIPSTAASEYRA